LRGGAAANREEILASINSGMPHLREVCFSRAAHEELDQQYRRALQLLPRELPESLPA